jgi:Trypsin
MTVKRALLVPVLVLSGVMASAGTAFAVTGGGDVADGDLPFVARLEIGSSDRACSGTLVHPQLVLTAASCFAGEDGTTRAGEPYRATTVTVGRSNLNGAGGAVVAVRDIVVNAASDVVLARLDTPVTTVAPVRIATTPPADGSIVTVAGFGRTRDEWVPSRLKSASTTVDGVSDGSFSLVPAGDATTGLCKGDAGGPALRFTGTAIELVGVHIDANRAGCVGEPATATPRATEARADVFAAWITANLPGFSTGFEAADPRPHWKNTVGTESGHGGLLNVTGVCCNLPGPELFTGVPPQGAHGGTQAVLYSGKDNNATTSYAYTKAFRLRNTQVRASTVLSYWIYPQSKATGYNYPEGANSTCVGVDLTFTDGSTLRDSGALDQRGNRAHPANQCNKMPLDQWSQVVVRLGDHSLNKVINTVSIGYDQGPNTGGYRGFVDDISISDIVRTDKFSSGLESGQPGLTWRNTVSTTAPGGGLLNVGGVCCGLTGPEMFVGEDPRAHGGSKVILYSGKDNNATKSFAYTGAFALTDVFVTPSTRLSYWIYPQSKSNSFDYADGTNSTCVAADLIFTDQFDSVKKSLRDAGVVDQNGHSIHPGAQCNRLTLDKWNYVSVPLGAAANGKQISQVDIGYDQSANTGGFRGWVDDVRITE